MTKEGGVKYQSRRVEPGFPGVAEDRSGCALADNQRRAVWMVDEFDLDWCYECTGLGDDYYFDEDGELVCACDECVCNPANRDE